MGLAFYAMPEEQRTWLSEHVERKDSWWLGWHPGKEGKYFPIRDRNDVQNLSFEADQEHALILFAGRCELSSPVWQSSSRGDELHFVKSQAIEFSPSLAAGTSVLLEGRLTIHRRSEYLTEGIDPTALSLWFRQMRRSLTSLMTQDAVVVQRTTDGRLKEWHDVKVTPGAVDWRQQGKLLKQFIKGAVELDISVLPHK